jgi:hypothetical protein
MAGTGEELSASKDVVLRKKAWVVVLTFIFMTDRDQRRDVAEEVRSFNRENFDVFAERRGFSQTAKFSDVSVSPFRYQKPGEASRQMNLSHSLEEDIDASRPTWGLSTPQKQLPVSYGVLPDLKFAFGVDYFCWHTFPYL